MKVYGPYKSKDRRSRVIIVHEDGRKQTISYPRFIMQNYLGVVLEENEDVHHIDGNVENNDISNLEVVLKSSHVSKHSTKYTESVVAKCYYCNCTILLSPKQQRDRFRESNRGKAGPFCSRVCSGKYGVEVQRALK